jgi:hypothetical protein
MALPALLRDLVEEILLRIPPDEPAHLIRAALVCKDWCRIISDGVFRRRYRRFHRTPPLLGYLNKDYQTAPKFVATTSFSPPPLPAGKCSDQVLDCRHGRVLIDTGGDPPGLTVWDLIAGTGQRLSVPTYHPHLDLCDFTGAVLCARHGCDHLDCHDGPFLVVFVGGYDDDIDDGTDNETHTSGVYSSETGAWSAQTPSIYDDLGACGPCLLIGDALYVPLEYCYEKILKYDLGEHGLSVVDTPRMFGAAVPMDIDGGLGFVGHHHGWIYTWSRQADVANGVGGWVRHDVAELEMDRWFSLRCLHPSQRDMICFAEGTNTILFNLNNYIEQGVFTLDLTSRQVRKVGETCGYCIDILPYTSFYTPGTTCAFLYATSAPCTCIYIITTTMQVTLHLVASSINV